MSRLIQRSGYRRGLRGLATWFVTIFSLIGLTSCTAEVSGPALSLMKAFSVNESSELSASSSGALQQPPQCAQTNKISLQLSSSAENKLWCRDLSELAPGSKIGQVCPGGVSIMEVSTDRSVVDCDKVTLCGVSPSSVVDKGERADGGKIKELVYENLPWGCSGRIETSTEADFAEGSGKELRAQVVVPACPFCERENRATCLPCAALNSNEQVRSGQVIATKCAGNTCQSCQVGSVKVPHGTGYMFYESTIGACGKKCHQQSQLRVCNNGLFEGQPKYSQTQCTDSVCGCKLPTSAVDYATNSEVSLYRLDSPACGAKCDGIRVKCQDGSWKDKTTLQTITADVLAQYPAKSCNQPVCDCQRPSRATIPDGTANFSVFSRSSVSCSESCNDFKGTLACNNGNLTATDSSHLGYAYDSCSAENCGCSVASVDAGSFPVANGASLTLYSKNQNSIDDPDACNNPLNQVKVACNAKTISPAYDSGLYKYRSCTTVAIPCAYPGSATPAADGTYKYFFKKFNNDCSTTCDSSYVRCQKGTWKTVSDLKPVAANFFSTYPELECGKAECNCKLPNGDTLNHGTGKAYYSISQGDCNPSSCEATKKTLTCSGGVVSGGDPNVHNKPSCVPKTCYCDLPWGVRVESNNVPIKIYAIKDTTCATSTACEIPANYTTVRCQHGSLTPTYDSSKFKYQVCQPASCSCRWAGVDVPKGQTTTFWKTEKPSPEISCSSVQAEFKCVDGKFEGTLPTSLIANYPASTCESLADQGVFGGTGGGSGNDEGPGSAFRKRFAAGGGGGGGGGSPCVGTDCREWGVDGYMIETRKASCTLPWDTGVVEHYSQVLAFSQTCVVKPARCSQFRQARMCHFNGWTGSSDFRFPMCEEKESCP